MIGKFYLVVLLVVSFYVVLIVVTSGWQNAVLLQVQYQTELTIQLIRKHTMKLSRRYPFSYT